MGSNCSCRSRENELARHWKIKLPKSFQCGTKCSRRSCLVPSDYVPIYGVRFSEIGIGFRVWARLITVV
eukprot:1393384-Amorphochlora_amoeboformis.AAC.1